MLGSLWERLLKVRLKGMWIKQYIVLISFYFFDYLVTIYYCKIPSDEWNIIAKYLMIVFNNIPLGMTIFFLGYSLIWYILLMLISVVVEDSKKKPNKTWYRIYLATNFIVFSLICGFDFGFGATSWFWQVDLIFRIALGTFLFVILYYSWILRD